LRRLCRLAWLIVCGLLLAGAAATIAGTFQATSSGMPASAGPGGAQADDQLYALGAALLSRGAHKRPVS